MRYPPDFNLTLDSKIEISSCSIPFSRNKGDLPLCFLTNLEHLGINSFTNCFVFWRRCCYLLDAVGRHEDIL